MTRIAIIDDEPAAIDLLTRICAESRLPIEVIGSAQRIQEGIDLVEREQPDLILLDIEFPEGSGFEVLHELSAHTPEVLFVTAHDSHAIQALREGALDYILKPIHPKEVTESLKRVLEIMEKKNHPRWLNQLTDSWKAKFKIPIHDGYRYIDLNQLIYLKADGSYAHLYFTDGSTTLVSKKLVWFDHQLTNRGFQRVHRSYLVNEQHISEFHRNDGGYLITTNGVSIPVSKNYRPL